MKTNKKEKYKLTKKEVDKLPLPQTGQVFIWDSELKGFGVRLTPKGISYIVQARVNGQTRRVTIGKHGPFAPDKARKQALEHLHNMSKGIDPTLEKRRKKVQGVTLEDVVKAYTSDRDLKANSIRDIHKHLDGSFQGWKDQPVTRITRDAVLDRFRELSEKGKAQANQAFRILRALLNYAQATYRPGGRPIIIENPVKVLSEAKLWHVIQPKNRRIPLEKVGMAWLLLEALRADPAIETAGHSMVDAVRFCLLTGARWGEVTALTWDRVNLDYGTWFLPDPKNRQPVTLPLSSQAKTMLDGRPRIDGNPYVFCSSKSRTGHIGPGRYITNQVSRALSIEISPHDLRRTFRAIAAEVGIELWRTKLLMNHKLSGDVTLGSYTEKSDLRYLKPEAQRIGDWIERQARIAATDKVVDMKLAKGGKHGFKKKSDGKDGQNDLDALKAKTAEARKKALEYIYSNKPRASSEEPRLEDDEIEENPCKHLNDKQLRNLLKDNTIITQAMKETRKSLKYLMNDVSIVPSDRSPRHWQVWHTIPLSKASKKASKIQHALQRAGLLIWYCRGEGTSQQRERVEEVLDLASMEPVIEHGRKLAGRKPGQRFKRNERLDRELREILDILGRDAVFHSKETQNEGTQKPTVMKKIEKRCGKGFFYEVNWDEETVEILDKDLGKIISFKTILNRLTNIKKDYR
jgi:integrase